MFGDSQWSNLRSALVGAVVAAVLMLSLPVVASVGGNLILGQANTADAVTSLSGSSAANLRITNSQAGSPALDLRVASGAPLLVNSNTRVVKLNADYLDGKHASAFSLLAHNHDGLYLPLAGVAADSSLLDGLDSTAFSAANHSHAGVYLPVNGTAADSTLLDGLDSAAFARQGALCPPGEVLVGYGRSGVQCSSPVGSVTVVAGPGLTEMPSLVLDASGFPVIAFQDLANEDLEVVHCGDATCSSENVIRSVDTTTAAGGYASLVLDASGYPVVSYYDGANGDLKVAHCGDPTCLPATTTIRAVDTAGDVGLYTSLVLDASGNPVISYMDWTNYDLRLLHCGDATCRVGNTIWTVDTTGQVGFWTSLVLDASGAPVVAYFDHTSDDLKVAHCGDATCSTGNTIRAVDTAGRVGEFPSLVLDHLGYPVISYRDGTNEDLKLVHCGDATCSTGNTIRAVDTLGVFGDMGTSLVLDTLGNPVIAYFDGTYLDLKVAHCWDSTCAGSTKWSVDTAGDVGEYPAVVLDASGQPVIACSRWGGGGLRLAAVVG